MESLGKQSHVVQDNERKWKRGGQEQCHQGHHMGHIQTLVYNGAYLKLTRFTVS